MPTTVFNVANHILNNSKKSKKSFDLLQLLKLCYLAYGWYLSYRDAALFEENIEAWKYGPVIPELYYALKHFRGKQLPSNCLENLKDDGLPLSEDMEGLIDEVVNYYGEYKGVVLSALTHKKGSPWEKTYRNGEQLLVSIPDEVIKNHFDELKIKFRG